MVDGKLHREFRFRDFVEAIGFMTSAALVIQEMDHHPEWFNVYQKVRVDLVTHSAGGVTATDVKLAIRLNELANRLTPA
ncbi:MAG: 4a-hydroxytetrahydrobiopterin dehydratase [bacterium]|nr:MAG: 4a-hydroxytetrahydrobiopterin dehydratase [bacterium]